MSAVPPPSEESLLGHVFLVPHRDDERTQHAATRTVLAALGVGSPAPTVVAAYTALLRPYYHSLWCPRAILTALDRNSEQRPYPVGVGAAAERLAEQHRRDRYGDGGTARGGRRDADGGLTPMERVVRSRLSAWNRSRPPMEGFRSLEELSEALHRRARSEHQSVGPVAAPGTRARATSRFRRPTRADAVRRVRESQDKIRKALDSLGPARLPSPPAVSAPEARRRAWEATQESRTSYYLDQEVTAAELPAVRALRGHRARAGSEEQLDEAAAAELLEAARRELLRHHRRRRRSSRFRASMDAIDHYLDSIGDAGPPDR
ncbi:hypothetical protein FHR81_003136 [Actinoalloteichus hoggarensis]|uniref:Uncharacterized protein n=1 Tax=Actinoalloteichus hoggarensis TaxID=1470176 RepID=A0A221W6K5_9PSEU|nr:hypothetical protein [Actinoalloteichus hoggarensis]ASO21495.1 hypothetical protein AHOG_19365 [Actinoalloteichus hoggarensis]MBB5922084.1 hypothetical protein [Actinoalloteichus hoggarensis]